MAEAGRDNVAKVMSEFSAADMTQAGPADMIEGSDAHVTAAKMHATEMAAATEVAATTVAAATAAAGKSARREAQCTNGDARQEHLCCLGHHDFPPDIGSRVSLYTPQSMFVAGNDFRRVALLEAGLRQCP